MNPLLRRLGFDARDRVAIVHADDVGMCQATLSAFEDLADGGLVSSGSCMVPCPWFPAVADLCRCRPELDLGVHLTLTSEWPGYRWGPLSTRDAASGLLDGDGCFPATAAAAAAADPEAVRLELAAQLARAEGAGLDATHLDVHMLALLAPRLLPVYRELAAERRLPAPVLRAAGHAPFPEGSDEAVGITDGEEGVCDLWVTLRLRRHQERIEQAKRLFAALPAGLTQISIHPAVDTPELRAVAADWPCRVADLAAFASGELRRHVQRLGVRVIGYRAVREALRAAAS